MKMKISSFFCALLFFCTLGLHSLSAQSVVHESSITADKATFEMITPSSYLMEIAGPNHYFFKQEIPHTNNISISNIDASGKKFADGTYLMQITPIISLTEKERQEIARIREKNDYERMVTFRLEHKLPEKVDVTNVYFSIRNGQFVTPDQKEVKGLNIPKMFVTPEQDHPALYASLNSITTEFEKPIIGNTGLAHAIDNTSLSEDAQVFNDDVIVFGSLCVGLDCNSSENFGFDTERLKENNLRIHFDDTSNSGSFPANDWRITINDSSNGGGNYFAIEDVTGGRTPFRIEAGAIQNALYVDSDGDVGIGTATPVVEVHAVDGNSPTLRLEQNGSSGFTPQTWDIAGNEANFFVRDVTNGSQLPFKIIPNAPSNSLVVGANGNIGLGTNNPSEKLHLKTGNINVESGNVNVQSGRIGINVAPTVALDVVGNSKFMGTSVFSGDASFLLKSGASFISSSTFSTVMRLDAINTRVGIGVAAPGHMLELSVDDAVKPNGGAWAAPSDKRLKTNIRNFEQGLEQILEIRPVTYNYNGKLGYPTDKEFIGVIAQEMQKIAPYTIKDLNHNREGENYLAFDPSSLTYLLVNAVQEQQEMIDAQQKEIDKLQNKLTKFSDLQAQLDTLNEMVSSLKEAKKSSDSSDEAIGEKK